MCVHIDEVTRQVAALKILAVILCKGKQSLDYFYDM